MLIFRSRRLGTEQRVLCFHPWTCFRWREWLSWIWIFEFVLFNIVWVSWFNRVPSWWDGNWWGRLWKRNNLDWAWMGGRANKDLMGMGRYVHYKNYLLFNWIFKTSLHSFEYSVVHNKRILNIIVKFIKLIVNYYYWINFNSTDRLLLIKLLISKCK